MCGIAGIFSLKKDVRAAWIKGMADTLRHRGPDDEGFLAADQDAGEAYPLTGAGSRIAGADVMSFEKKADLFLAHRRLAILDLSANGHQPMSSPRGDVWAVYNGEIYNYMELKEELKKKGHTFRTDTDTEVLLASYDEWGGQCIHRFNGMWAFVIYDMKRHILFGSRDRFGVKPFYYYLDRERFAFASEIKALLCLPFVKKEINPEAVFDYLAMGIEEGSEEGFFRGVFDLPPSTAFVHDLNGNILKKWRYYSLSPNDEFRAFDPATARQHARKTRELVFNAVKARLVSDVPAGSCLSGGVDSSSIVCTVNSLLSDGDIPQIGDSQKVFTASYDMKEIDESGWAGKVVESTRTSWMRTFPRPEEFMEDLEDLVYSQDIPFGSTSIYAQYRVMRLARESGVKVLLDGQGGDELFTGYPVFYGAFFMELVKNRALPAILNEFSKIGNAPLSLRALMKELMRFTAANTAPRGLIRAAYRRKAKENGCINRDLWHKYSYRLDTLRARKPASLNRMLDKSISGGLKTLLRYEDRNSMRFSIESRTPFADDINLIESSFRIPSVYKIHNGWSKYLLREAMRGVVPEEILSRRDKAGFSTPERLWLSSAKERLKRYLIDASGDFIDTGKLLARWDTYFEGRPGAGLSNLWRLINFSVWQKIYGVK